MKTVNEIDAKLDRIDELHAALVLVYHELAAELAVGGDEYAHIVDSTEIKARSNEGNCTNGLRYLIAEIRRPKGPMVALRWTGRCDLLPSMVEVTRRTEKRVLVGANYGRAGTWYDLSDGRIVKNTRSRYLRTSGSWVISDEGLEQIRSMPVGENDVSRALKAVKS